MNSQERPNIIILLADDLGIGDVATYGFNSEIKTPSLDQMSENGLRFDRFYAQAPVCSPTRGSYLTSRHPFRYGVFEANIGILRPEEVTLSEVLQENNYATGHFGKWHLGALSEKQLGQKRMKYNSPTVHGYDEWFATYSSVDTNNPYGPDGDYMQSLSPYYENGELITGRLMGDDSRIIMNKAIPFIEKSIARKESFFATIWFHTPHKPVHAEEQYKKIYSHLDNKTQEYYGAITAMDEQIGRLRAFLRKKGVSENTIILFSSDNGPINPGSSGPYTAGKRHLFEGGVRVPGIIEWPSKIKNAKTTDIVAASVDMMPTLLDIANIKIDESIPMDGISLKPLLDGQHQKRDKLLFFQSHGSSVAMNQDYKALKVRTGAFSEGQINKSGLVLDTWMLFEMNSDSKESKDISAKHQDSLLEMTTAYEEWNASCKKSFYGDDYAYEFETTAIYRDNGGLMKKKNEGKKKNKSGKKKNKNKDGKKK
ncbi:MAG: sulfatase-like hydrolase/transferase [Urechidicola sp.]|nr:sulfatase-like hydrolase/transferase [Urechidicola sp.]